MGMKPGVVKAALVVMGLCLAGYILGPPLYWHSIEVINALTHSSSATCPPCNCDCSSSSSDPILAIPLEITRHFSTFHNRKRRQSGSIRLFFGLSNTSLSDCAKRDPEVSEDTEKNFADLLSEELKLRESEALESQRHADMALLEAKKIASQYQKEADKCNSGMETCEEAREKSEAAFIEQRRVTAMWERRARERGWKEGAAKVQSL